MILCLMGKNQSADKGHTSLDLNGLVGQVPIVTGANCCTPLVYLFVKLRTGHHVVKCFVVNWYRYKILGYAGSSVPSRVRNLRKMQNFWANFINFEPEINIIKCKTEKLKQNT